MLLPMFWRQIVPLAVFSVGTTVSALDAFDVWHPRNAIPTVNRLNNVAYGAGRFISVGDQGTVLISSNGLDWSVSPPFVTNDLNTVVYVENRFFVGGDRGLILWSEDGTSWHNASVPVIHDVTAIGFGRQNVNSNGIYVAAFYRSGGSFGLLNSLDGENWTTNATHNPGIASYSCFTRVSYGNGRFVMSGTGNGSDGTPLVIYSSDGGYWESFFLARMPVAFGNGLFVAPRHVATTNGLSVVSLASTNGQLWLPTSSSSGSGGPSSASFAGGRFFASWASPFSTDTISIATSIDATNWTVHSTEANAPVWALAYGGGQYIAVGDRGVILSSADATNWTRRSTTGFSLQSVAPAAHGFVAVGSAGTAMFSDDGVDWIEFKTATTNNLRDVTQAAGRYVAVGEKGTILSGNEMTNLIARASGTEDELSGVAFGGESFVAVGTRETILSSPDAISWVVRNVGASNRLRGVVYGSGVFVTVGENGSVFTSADATMWIPRNSGTTRPLTCIVFAANRFVVTASGTSMLVSTDGVNWSIFSNVRPSSTGVSYGNGYFLATAQVGGPSRILISPDGENWESRTNVTGWPRPTTSFLDGQTVRDLAYNNDTFVAVGVYGLILQSDPVFRIEIARGESSRVTVLGPSNKTYRIESAHSLDSGTSWTERTTLFQPPFEWVDESPDASNRLYRAVLVP